MVDKIVQLQDEDGNNIFPLCRGLGNGTVTDASIDWSTMGGTDYISQISFTGMNSIGADSYFIKFPNKLVVFRISGTTTVQFATGGTNFATIPATLKPKGNPAYTFFVGSNPWASAVSNLAIYIDGNTVYLRAYPLANKASGSRFDFFGVYMAES